MSDYGRGPERMADDDENSPNGSAPRTVSVIIPVLNGADVLPDQLEALASQSYAGPWEVIVADNGSSDATREVAAAFGERLPRLKVLAADQRAGPSHARNVGAREATGDLLLFCDADDVVSPQWIAAMVAASETSSLLAGSGAEALDPHTIDRSSSGRPWPQTFKFLPWIRSSNIGVDRAVFESLRGFDEARMVAEDVDFCWRAQIAGHELRFVRDAFVAYRDRSSFWTAMQRQFRFGKAAPSLFRDYSEQGAPRQTLRGAFIDLFLSILRLPVAILRADLRAWCNRVAGGFGRLVGTVRS